MPRPIMLFFLFLVSYVPRFVILTIRLPNIVLRTSLFFTGMVYLCPFIFPILPTNDFS